MVSQDAANSAVELNDHSGKVYDVTEFLDGEPCLVTRLVARPMHTSSHFQTTLVRLLILNLHSC